jgi:hypothetical protein
MYYLLLFILVVAIIVFVYVILKLDDKDIQLENRVKKLEKLLGMKDDSFR